MTQIPDATQTFPIPLHELYGKEEPHDTVAVYAYGFYPKIRFAASATRHIRKLTGDRKALYTSADVLYQHIQEREEDGGDVFTQQCQPEEFGSACITLIVL